MLISRLIGLSLALGLWPTTGASACIPRDFLALPLPVSDRPAVSLALELAYPGLRVDDASGVVRMPGGASLSLGQDEGRDPATRLQDASIAEQFAQIYPTSFDLDARLTPWFDPGRARNDAFFRALYGDSEAEVAKSLMRVTFAREGVTARFAMSDRHCAGAQLQAALDAIAAEPDDMSPYFRDIGGSFNWRKIAGTDRLSAHSFGISVDFNTKLGGYWRWSGATEGNAGAYDNRYPEALVRHMERFGYVWGGKWHHFDGMHFEYRPELILHARLVSSR